MTKLKVVLENEDTGEQTTSDRIYYDTDLDSFVAEDMDVWFGQSSQIGNDVTPPFRYNHGTGKIESRSVVFHEQGDAVDVGMGRVGPDNTTPEAGLPPQTVEPGKRLGGLYGRTYIEGSGWAAVGPDGEPAFALNGEFAVWTSASYNQGTQSRPGRAVIRTTKPGNYTPDVGLTVDEFQRTILSGSGHQNSHLILYQNSNGDCGFGVHDTGRRYMNVFVDSQLAASFRRPGYLQPGHAALALQYKDHEGNLRYEEIRVGSDGILRIG